MDELERHRGNVDFSDVGEYLITDREIALIPTEHFAEFAEHMYAQAASYDMSVDVLMQDDGILIKWQKNAS